MRRVHFFFFFLINCQTPNILCSLGRSRSEDSVYSPASDDGGSRSDGSTDSKSSIDIRRSQPTGSHHSFGRLNLMAALTRKRKKFSTSRASTPAMTSTNSNPTEGTTQPITSILLSKISKKELYRASSVPNRSPDLDLQTMTPNQPEATQSQQPGLETIELTSVNEEQS